jgi:RAT1-interacting protein
MAYYRPAPLGADLNHGFERRIERDEETEEHLDGLCESLMRLIQKGKGAERRGGIITWRGMITRWVASSVYSPAWKFTTSLTGDPDCYRMMTAPFEDREGWEMSALALDGSVYVELYDPPEVRAKRYASVEHGVRDRC